MKRAMYLEPVLTNLPGLQKVQGSSYTKVEKGMKRILPKPKADTPRDQSHSYNMAGFNVFVRLVVMIVHRGFQLGELNFW